MAIVRAWGLALLALGVWLYVFFGYQPRHIADIHAPADAFSAARAENVLATLLGPERPHPVGSAENAAVRARIIDQFAKLGVHAGTYRAFTCHTERRFPYVPCATVTDIIADAIPGAGKAIVLLAHYDSVPAGPGASDDESGVATVLETVRALKARSGRSLHPVMAVITDGEEAGLLGANAFLQNPQLKARVGAVVNVEARGTKGPSLLFQTSPGDARLIDLYAKSVPVYATSSLYAEIYRLLPNDTDLTLFIRDGFPSFNFAFADNVRYYHSPLDIRANLHPGTLQMHGNNLLGVASALEKTPFEALKGGNAIYLTLFGAALPRLPESLALPLSLVVFFALVLAVWLARPAQPIGVRAILLAAVMPLALLVGSGLFGWLLSFIAASVSGHPDPTYAYPAPARVAFAFAVWTMTLIASRMVTVEAAAASVWLWIGGLGVINAALLPGFSPYFLFPALVAAAALLATARNKGGWSGTAGQIALFISALAAFVIWIPLVVSGETLMGLRLHPLFTLPTAFALMAAVPLMAARPMSQPAARASVIVSALAAVVLAVVAGLEPPYSEASPQRVNIVYFENEKGPARFIADTSWKGVGTEPIPSSLMKAGPFTLDQNAWSGLLPGSGFTAPAGPPLFRLPTATILRDQHMHGARSVEIEFHGSMAARGMLVMIPKEAGLVSLEVRGQHYTPQDRGKDVRLICSTPDCNDLALTLFLSRNGAVEIPFAEIRQGLPPAGGRLVAARGPFAMASQSGDETLLADRVKLLPPKP